MRVYPRQSNDPQTDRHSCDLSNVHANPDVRGTKGRPVTIEHKQEYNLQGEDFVVDAMIGNGVSEKHLGYAPVESEPTPSPQKDEFEAKVRALLGK